MKCLICGQGQHGGNCPWVDPHSWCCYSRFSCRFRRANQAHEEVDTGDRRKALALFGLVAKLYAHQVDPVFVDPRVTRWLQYFAVERGILFGLTIATVGAALAIPVVGHWFETRQVP